MIYQHGFEFEINEKDITKEDIKELEKSISKFLIDKGYINSKIHRVGLYNLDLEPTWKDCKSII